jgi:hypothetical protein
VAIQESVTMRNNKLEAIETTLGVSPHLKIRSGAIPANCAAARTGTVLTDITLPADLMSDAASGSKSKLGTWEDTSADATGLAGYFHIDSSGGTCHMQGLCAQVWEASVAYALNQQVSNDTGKCYKCITAGISAASGGPTGTGADITDGAAHWQYIGTVDMTLQNTSLVATQDVTITSFSLTEGNA